MNENGVHELLNVPAIVHKDLLLEPLFSPQEISVGEYPESPIDVVRQLVKGPKAQAQFEDGADERHVYCEMLELSSATSHVGYRMPNYVWQERARWIKFEETVEEEGRRWSKPHVTILSPPSILQVRNCLKKGATLLDVDAEDFAHLTSSVLSSWEAKHDLDGDEVEKLRRIILSPKHHLYKSEFRDRLSPATAHGSTLDLSSIKSAKAESANLEGDTVSSQDSQANGNDSLKPPEEFHRPTTPTGDEDQAKTAMTGNLALLKKIPESSEAVAIFIGQFDGISTPLAAFVRLTNAQTFLDIPDVNIPTRFVIFLISPANHTEKELDLLGRCYGTMMVDKVFSSLAYQARTPQDLALGVDEFISQALVIPPGRWSTDLRWEPQEEARKVERDVGKSLRKMTMIPHAMSEHHHVPLELQRTGRFFGGFVEDIKRKAAFYVSDFMDVFRSPTSFTQCVASSLFLFFANIAIIITFAGVMETLLEGYMGAVENLLAAGICGMTFALTAGQPLCILSATGPVLVFEVILFGMCRDFGYEFYSVRFWVSAWSCLLLLIIVAVDGNSFIAWITKFTEEAFATLISVIFIIQAFEKLISLGKEAPLTKDPNLVLNDPCLCNITTFDYTNLTGRDVVGACELDQGKATGLQCDFRPDVFLFSVILFFSTFTIAYGLKKFRNSGFLPSKVRAILADFNVFISIVLMTGLTQLVGLKITALQMPEKFAPTKSRPWIVNPMGMGTEDWWLGLVAVVPAALFIILVVMDQQITSVIINRKENKLKKGYGYYLDLTVVALLILVCGLLGIPFFVAGTVNSIIHVDSLKMMSEVAAPGEKPQFLGVREQRITPLVAHFLIGMSVFLAPVIKLIPLAVLLGVFLYMGVVSLAGQEFVHRVLLYFTPVKYQPDFRFLRIVPLSRVHIFTAIQLVALFILVAVKYAKTVSMLFPLMLVVLMLIRKLLDRFFTQRELIALDDALPPFRELIVPSHKLKLGREQELADPELSPMLTVPAEEKKSRFGGLFRNKKLKGADLLSYEKDAKDGSTARS